MRILILANSDGGLYRFRRELLSELLHPGSYLSERASAEPCEVHIALPKGEFVHKFVEWGCHFVEVPVDRRGMNLLKDVKLYNIYCRILKDIRPDAVLTYTVKPNVYGGLACRRAGIPCFANITGLGTSIQNEGILQQLVLFLYRIGVANARCTFFQNLANMEFMRRHQVGSAKQCLLPGSGVDLVSRKYRAYPDEGAGIRFLSVMRIMKDKGIGELLTCAEQIKKAYPHVTFSVAGSYDEESYRGQLEQAHQEGWVEYLGVRNDIEELMAQHHCIIHPSYHEGLSNVLLEAAACGRPVIASNVPGCSETFEEGVSGFGFEARNADMLVECVKKFINIPHQRKEQMGKAGRKKVENEFDRKQVVRSYTEHLDKLQH